MIEKYRVEKHEDIDNTWSVVRSDERPLKDKEEASYVVRLTQEGWTCECPDHHYRKRVCKHIRLVQGVK